MHNLIRHLTATAIAVGFIGLAPSVYATPITDGLVIVNGDKTFVIDTCTVAGSAAGQFTCLELEATPFTDANGDLGFQIQGTMTAIQGTTLDVFLRYHAFINSGSMLFDDASLTYNGNVVTSVLETINDGNAPFGQEAQLTVFNPPPVLSAHATFDHPTNLITVTKDIGLNCTNTNVCGQANISIVTQTFSQVPEPGSLALLGLGLASLAAWGRRRGAK